MKKGIWVLLALALGIWAMPQVFADRGIDHSNPDAVTLMDAAAALEATDPDLAAKVRDVAVKTFPEQPPTQEHGGVTQEHGGKKEHGGS